MRKFLVILALAIVSINAIAHKKDPDYLNPTPNDRNLEWDMKNNLCPTQEGIHNPQP